MARVKTGALRAKAIIRARRAYDLWLYNGIKAKGDKAGSFDLITPEHGSSFYIWIGVIEGTEPLPYRQWVVELKTNGALISAFHQAG